MRRFLGVPGLFSAGYGDVGSSIYYGLGIVAIAALGAAPIALMAAGVVYIFNALSYAEGGAMIPEAGGSASFARHGINNLVGFIAGWALMLSYIATMAISAYTIPPYLAYFWPVLDKPCREHPGLDGDNLLSDDHQRHRGQRVDGGEHLFHLHGRRHAGNHRYPGGSADTGGGPGKLVQHMFGAGNFPSASNLVLGIAIAALCFTGVETVSQLAEETRRPAERIPQAYVLMIVVVMVLFAGISVVALSAMTPQVLGDPINGWARDPVAGIAANLPSETLRGIFAPLVAVLAASILLTASNAGLLGISRLTFNLSSHQQLPAAFGKVHKVFRTPYVAIIVFCLITLVLLAPGFSSPRFFTQLGALYVFGSLLCFAFAHIAILSLRIRKPDLPRPFKLGLNIRFRGADLPLTAILGALTTIGIWIVVLVTEPFSRWVGFGWMAFGLAIYLLYRLFRPKPVEEWEYKPEKKS